MQGLALLNTSSDASISYDLQLQIGTCLGKQQVQIAAAYQRTALQVAVCKTLADVPPGFVPSTIQDTLPDPGALAFHSTDENGRPYILIGWGIIKANGGQLISGADALSSTIGHEFCEAFADPYCDWWWDLPDGSGEIPLEACDSTQGDFYDLDGVAMTNFLWPRYFSSEAGQLDQMNLLGPNDHGVLRKGGYYGKRIGGPTGTNQNFFGAEIVGGGMPAWLRDAKAASHSRAAMRKNLHPKWIAGWGATIGGTP